LDERDAETDTRSVLRGVGGVEDVGEEEADELEGYGDDYCEGSAGKHLVARRTVPEESEEVAGRHPIYQYLVSANRRGQGAKGRV
jgi:hypothetical protein